MLRISNALGVIAKARRKRVGASTTRTRVSSGDLMKSARGGRDGEGHGGECSSDGKVYVTTAQACASSSRGRWMRALENPWSNSSPITPM